MSSTARAAAAAVSKFCKSNLPASALSAAAATAGKNSNTTELAARRGRKSRLPWRPVWMEGQRESEKERERERKREKERVGGRE
jgi:hypothetical protein